MVRSYIEYFCQVSFQRYLIFGIFCKLFGFERWRQLWEEKRLAQRKTNVLCRFAAPDKNLRFIQSWDYPLLISVILFGGTVASSTGNVTSFPSRDCSLKLWTEFP